MRVPGRWPLASIHAVVEHDGRPLNIIGTHPLPPGGQAYWQWRNDQLNHLASYIAGLAGETVLLGDLNVTPWSYYFGKFATDSGLRDEAMRIANTLQRSCRGADRAEGTKVFCFIQEFPSHIEKDQALIGHLPHRITRALATAAAVLDAAVGQLIGTPC